MAKVALVLTGVASASCSSNQATQLPPLGEALIVVDTDLPLSFAPRLRVDVYEDGRWIESRDIVRPTATSWPASFSVFSPDPGGARTATLRLRVYPEGSTRDYHGERSARRRPTPLAPGQRVTVVGDDTPRLMRNGVDVTPKLEPIPLMTVDRLIDVHVTPGMRGAVSVVLRGACLGTMADVKNAMTCVDEDSVLVPVMRAEPAGELITPATTVLGTFPPKATCALEPRAGSNAADGTPLFDDEVCVDAALFRFGVPYAEGLIYDEGVQIPAVLSPFLIDRWELTVGRLRQATREGFKLPSDDPIRTDAETGHAG